MSKKICGLTPEEIEELKKEHGFLILGTVKHGNKEYQAIFKEPSYQVLEAIRKVQKNNDMQGAKAMYNNCVVIADKAIEDRDYLKIKAAESIGKHLQSFQVEVKNL